MKGWILDVYPNLKKGKMTLWLRTKKRCYKVEEDYDPVFFLRSTDGDYSRAEEIFSDMDFQMDMVERKTSIYENEEKEVMRVSPGKVFDPRKQAGALDFFEGYEKYRFFDVDIPLDQRFLIDNDIKPFSLVEKDGGWHGLERDDMINYSLPDLRTVHLDIEIDSDRLPCKDHRLLSVEFGDEKIHGDEEEIIKGLNRSVERYDPDVIITEKGDTFIIPYLAHRGELNGVELKLGRERKMHPFKRGSTYHSYGRVLYKPPSYTLRGRIHIDKSSSFMYKEGGLEGLIDISRLSGIPLQRVARRSPGSAIDAMEIARAMKDGYLIPWKENITERFKTARKLILSDRGGHIFEPKVGVHEDVYKLDFASMYPSIISEYNLSPETLGCKCSEYHTVPELGYKVCERRKGLIPRVVGPVVERRQRYKELAKKNGGERYSQRSSVLKWLLVTCFGYTGYKKARFSNIEVHESITAYGRDILLSAADIAQEMDFEVMHGIVDSLWIKGEDGYDKKVSELIERVNEKTGMVLEREGKYDWVVFLPSRSDPEVGVPNRYYGLLNGELEAKGVHMRRRDTPRFFKAIQNEMLEKMAEVKDVQGLKEEGVPDAIERVRSAFQTIRSGKAPLNDLFFTKTVSKKAEDYAHMTESKAALLQYRDMGIRVRPGQKIKYVVTKRDSKDPNMKVAIEGETGEYYDKQFYEKYLYRVASEILIPFEYSEKDVENKVKYG
ncbi:MAG: DNA polymerase domain-containing protein [Thermoplasmatota archaeon]